MFEGYLSRKPAWPRKPKLATTELEAAAAPTERTAGFNFQALITSTNLIKKTRDEHSHHTITMTNFSSEIPKTPMMSNAMNAYMNILQEQVYYNLFLYVIIHMNIKYIFKRLSACTHHR